MSYTWYRGRTSDYHIHDGENIVHPDEVCRLLNLRIPKYLLSGYEKREDVAKEYLRLSKLFSKLDGYLSKYFEQCARACLANDALDLLKNHRRIEHRFLELTK